MGFVKHVYDNVHGYIGLTEVEVSVVDTPTFQRLRRVSQLGPAELVYPGATHTRFAHSLGAMHLAGRLAQVVVPEADRQLIRLAALLHDVGHPPFSHTLEQATGVSHEEVGRILTRSGELSDVISAQGYDPAEVAEVAWGRTRLESLVISSPLDADRLDYLLRDSLHTGVTYGRPDVERILRVIRRVSLGGSPALGVPARSLHAVEHFLLCRAFMFRTVYLHKTVVAFELMLSRAYELASELTGLPTGDELIDLASSPNWPRFDDHAVACALRAVAAESEPVAELVSDLEARRPPKLVAERGGEEGDRLLEAGCEGIAGEAGVPSHWVLIGTPSLPSAGHAGLITVVSEDGSVVPLESATSGLVPPEVLVAAQRTVRVYTRPEYAGRVAEAVRKVLRR